MIGTIELTEEAKGMDGCIIECYPQSITDTTNRWVFNRLKTDREHPNELKSIMSIEIQYTLVFPILINLC